MAAHVHEQGKRPVFQSFEMTNAEQVQRYDAMQAGVSYTRMREGQLTKSELVPTRTCSRRWTASTRSG